MLIWNVFKFRSVDYQRFCGLQKHKTATFHSGNWIVPPLPHSPVLPLLLHSRHTESRVFTYPRTGCWGPALLSLRELPDSGDSPWAQLSEVRVCLVSLFLSAVCVIVQFTHSFTEWADLWYLYCFNCTVSVCAVGACCEMIVRLEEDRLLSQVQECPRGKVGNCSSPPHTLWDNDDPPSHSLC